MGIFSAPKVPAPPAPPDPGETAEAQAAANRVTQFTPSGNLIFGTVGAGGEFVPKRGDPDQAALQIQETPFQRNLRLSGEAEISSLANQLSGSTLGDVRTADDIFGVAKPELLTDFATETQRLEDATFNAASARLQPQFERQRRQIEQRLADQGIPISSDAYQEEINRLEESQNEQLSRLALDSVATGRAEQDRLTRLGAALRGQTFNEQFSLRAAELGDRQQTFQELGALLGFNTPFSQTAVAPIDVAGITNANYQNALMANQIQARNQQAAAQQRANTFGTLGSIAGFALSDVRAKENIKMVGEGKINIYEFNYKGDDKRYRGVMAQEVEKVVPQAVITLPDGMKAVNYDMLGIKMEAA